MGNLKRALGSFPGKVVWGMPGSFTFAKLLGGNYSLRCVLFHHISNYESSFTQGLGVRMGVNDFEARLRFLKRYYSPVSLSQVLSAREHPLPERAVLVTFDDPYSSVAEEAAPLCRKYSIPAVFFVSAAFIGNQDIALDNIVCFVTNTLGFERVLPAAREASGMAGLDIRNMSQLFERVLPLLPLEKRWSFKKKLLDIAGQTAEQMAATAKLYLSKDQARQLAGDGFELGNHTYSHVSCRVLAGEEFRREIDDNNRALEELSGQEIRAFSVPYGSFADLTCELVSHLRRSSSQIVVVVESRPNTPDTSLYGIYRVSLQSRTDADCFTEIEILPRLRAMRDRIRGSRDKHLEEVRSGIPCLSGQHF